MSLTFTSEIKKEDYEEIKNLLDSYREFQQNHPQHYLPLLGKIPTEGKVEEYLNEKNRYNLIAKDNNTIMAFASWLKVVSQDIGWQFALEALVFKDQSSGEKLYQEFERLNQNEVIFYNLSRRMLDYSPWLINYPNYIYLLPGEKELRLCFVTNSDKGKQYVKKLKYEKILSGLTDKTLVAFSQWPGVEKGPAQIIKEEQTL